MAGTQPIVEAQYASLVLTPTSQLHPFTDGYLKHLPRFNGKPRSSTEDHLATFLDFVDDMIYTRLFVQSLERNVRICFRQLQLIHGLN